jgi:hypothetical protein
MKKQLLTLLVITAVTFSLNGQSTMEVHLQMRQNHLLLIQTGTFIQLDIFEELQILIQTPEQQI